MSIYLSHCAEDGSQVCKRLAAALRRVVSHNIQMTPAKRVEDLETEHQLVVLLVTKQYATTSPSREELEHVYQERMPFVAVQTVVDRTEDDSSSCRGRPVLESALVRFWLSSNHSPMSFWDAQREDVPKEVLDLVVSKLNASTSTRPQEVFALEDGQTELCQHRFGGVLQTNSQTGLTIREFPDGSRMQHNSQDNTVLHVSSDGTKQLMFNRNTASAVEIQVGVGKKSYLKSGIIIHETEAGEKHQYHPDGLEIHQYPDGRKVQVNANRTFEIVDYPDGSRDQTYLKTGATTHIKAGTVRRV